jgi:hypothetical protein
VNVRSKPYPKARRRQFITELTVNPASHAFINEKGCDRYFRYDKDVLLDDR